MGVVRLPARPQEIQATKQLFVEGAGPKGFFVHLVNHLNLKGVEVHDFGGNNERKSRLSAHTKTPEFGRVERLGIICDAESNAEDIFQSVTGALTYSGLAYPTRAGQITSGAIPCVGVYILPDNTSAGSIEHLCLKSVAGTPLFACVEEFMKCVDLLQHDPPTKRWNSVFRSKAQIAAFLAAQAYPGLPIGHAAGKGYWSWNNTAFESIKRFLQDLFS